MTPSSHEHRAFRAIALLAAIASGCGGAVPTSSSASAGSARHEWASPLPGIAQPATRLIPQLTSYAFLTIDELGRTYVATICVERSTLCERDIDATLLAQIGADGRLGWHHTLETPSVSGLALARPRPLVVRAAMYRANRAPEVPGGFEWQPENPTEVRFAIDPDTGRFERAIARVIEPETDDYADMAMMGNGSSATIAEARDGIVALWPRRIVRLSADLSIAPYRSVATDPYTLAMMGDTLVTLSIRALGSDWVSEDDDAPPPPAPVSSIESSLEDGVLSIVVRTDDRMHTDYPALIVGQETAFIVGRFSENAITCGTGRIEPAGELDGFVAAIGNDGACRFIRAFATPGRDSADAAVATADGGVLVGVVQSDADGREGTIELVTLDRGGAPRGERRRLGRARAGIDGVRAIARAPDGSLRLLVRTLAEARSDSLTIPAGASIIRLAAP